MAESGYLFTKQVIAEYLGVSKDQVVFLVKEGAPIAKNERGTYWTMKDPLDRWLNERLVRELGVGAGCEILNLILLSVRLRIGM